MKLKELFQKMEAHDVYQVDDFPSFEIFDYDGYNVVNFSAMEPDENGLEIEKSVDELKKVEIENLVFNFSSNGATRTLVFPTEKEFLETVAYFEKKFYS